MKQASKGVREFDMRNEPKTKRLVRHRASNSDGEKKGNCRLGGGGQMGTSKAAFQAVSGGT